MARFTLRVTTRRVASIKGNSTMFFVYVIESLKDGTRYIGFTGNIEKRLIEHNQGKTKSIKHKVPLKLVYIEEYESKTEARK